MIMNGVINKLPKGYFFFINCLLPLVYIGCSSPRLFTDINHIVHMGQSLGGGEQSLPVITDTATGFGNLSFKMGTFTWAENYYPDQPEKRSADSFAFVPLKARARGAEGETIANGLADHLSQSLVQTKYKNARFLFSYAGQGGRYLRELDKRHDDAKDPRAGTRQSKGGHYITSVDDVKRAKRISDSLHASYSVAAITWMQGERGNDARINRWDSMYSRSAFLALYKNDLIVIKRDYQQDILGITGQKKRPPFFTYQTNGAMSGTAQLMACDEEKDMYMVSPTYMLPSAVNSRIYVAGKMIRGAAVHITADGERMLGELFGKVIRKVVLEKQQWQPLRPTKAQYDKNGQSLLLSFHVPSPPLVLDSSFLPRQGNGWGFEIYDDRNHVYAIKQVQLAGNTGIKISLVDPLPAGTNCFVKYGLSSYVANITATVKNISIGNDSIKIVFKGNIAKQFDVLQQEGAFYLGSRAGTGAALVHSVVIDENGDTVLSGETETAKNFGTDQQYFVSRIFGYGNVHDSDAEKSVFHFRDTTYGTRAGQTYPLYNWCIIFQDLIILK